MALKLYQMSSINAIAQGLHRIPLYGTEKFTEVHIDVGQKHFKGPWCLHLQGEFKMKIYF